MKKYSFWINVFFLTFLLGITGHNSFGNAFRFKKIDHFAKLTNAPYKRYVEIGEGTHTVIMEKNRMQLFQAVQQFLDEDLKPER